MNNKDDDQTARMHRLICVFVVRIWQVHIKGFLKQGRSIQNDGRLIHMYFSNKWTKFTVIMQD